MGDSGSDIIIKGGSVELEFNGTIYEKNPGDPKKHKSSNMRITRIAISGDKTFDSGDMPSGFKGTITLTCN